MEPVRLRVLIPPDHRLHLDVPVPDYVTPGRADVTVIIEPEAAGTDSRMSDGTRIADLAGYLKDRNPHPHRRVTVEDMNAAIARRMRERAQ